VFFKNTSQEISIADGYEAEANNIFIYFYAATKDI
jgi:hypothetical protein